MKNNYTHISFIIDESGSMATLVSDTIGGVNNFIKEQKKIPGDATLSLVLFNHGFRRNLDFANLQMISNFSDYVPAGNTALLDAIGTEINYLGEKLAKLPDHERPSKVIVVIITDGMENASRKFNNKQINDLITLQKTNYAWDFVFLAANQDAIAVADSYGIGANSAINYGTNNTSSAYQVTNCCITRSRSASAPVAFTEEERKELIK